MYEMDSLTCSLLAYLSNLCILNFDHQATIRFFYVTIFL